MLQGYPIESGYKGYVDGRYMLFETEEAYYRYMTENEEETKCQNIQN